MTGNSQIIGYFPGGEMKKMEEARTIPRFWDCTAEHLLMFTDAGTI